MFKYKDGVLYVRQLDIERPKYNIMQGIQDSYLKYLSVTVHEDIKYLQFLLNEQSSMKDVTISARIGSLKSIVYNKTQVYSGKYYYPVLITCYIQGHAVTPEFELLRIPFMDDYGKLNVDGKQKVMTNVLRSAEEVSYQLDDHTFNISMPYANVRLKSKSKDIIVRFGKANISVLSIIKAMLHEIGSTEKVSDTLVSTYLMNALRLGTEGNNVYAHADLTTRSEILTKFKSEQYKLGKTRNSLNEALDIKRGIGFTLSRPVLNYERGTVVTEEMIKDFKRNQINCYYVQNTNIPQGYVLNSIAPLLVHNVMAGTINCPLLMKYLPQFATYNKIPQTVILDKPIIIPNNIPLNDDYIELLMCLGYQGISAKPQGSSSTIYISFEREIVGNYTARLRELTTNIGDDRYADEWVYYYNNPSLAKSNPEWLTPHDLIAIVSIMGDVEMSGKTSLHNRDNSFLKKVLCVNELFSETLRKAMNTFVQTKRGRISQALHGKLDPNEAFGGLTSKWTRIMIEEKFLVTTDTLNLAAEISQVNHINTILPSSSEVLDEMRHLAMPFYGRICPFETPSGKKLGLVNTKAIGAVFDDGNLLVPYRRIKGTSDGITLSNNIEYLDVKSEIGHKVTDMLSFERDKNGKILNTPVLARVPNPEISDEPFIMQNVMAYDMAGGYVTAYPEQFLSPTANLIPGAGYDDPVRISYGLSQIRQAIYLANSKPTLVRTPMYTEMFGYSGAKEYHAPVSGKVQYIDNMHATILSDESKLVDIPMQGEGHIGRRDVTMELKVTVGQTVNKGDLLAEAHKYPQPYVVRAPYDCVIVKMTDDAIHIKHESPNYITGSPLLDMDIISFEDARISGQTAVFMNVHVSVGDHLKKGDIIADTCASRGGIYTPGSQPLTAYVSNGYNYEDGVCTTQSGSMDFISLAVRKKDISVSLKKYNSARAVSCKGFKYRNPGEALGTIIRYPSVNKDMKIETHVKASLKTKGIPFMSQLLQDTGTRRTYRFWVLSFDKLHENDKMSGRHGNKGVVSKVLDDSQAYQLKNGLVCKFMLNPCGVPSRMNLGQIAPDAHMGLAAKLMGIPIDSDSYSGATLEDIDYLLNYVYTLANTESIGDNVTKTYNKQSFDIVCAGFPMLPKEVHEKVWENIEEIIDWRGVFERDGSAQLYDPVTETFTDGRATIGFPTLLKLMQEGDEKINSRAGALQEEYSRTTSQPQQSEISAKGQRMGEMELVALAALGASNFIDEVINLKGDNEGVRINKHLDQLGLSEHRLDARNCQARSVTNLLYMLEGMGVTVEADDGEFDISASTSLQRETLDLRRLVAEELDMLESRQNKVTADDLSDVGD